MARMSIDQAVGLAQQHLAEGRVADAGAILTAVVQAAPEHADAHNLLGLVAYHQGNPLAAEAYFRHAVVLDGRKIQYRNDLSGILNVLGRPAEGEAVARQTLSLDPQNILALNNLGAALQGQSRPHEAIDVYRQVCQLSPEMFEAHVNLANSLQVVGRLAEAVELHRRVIERWPHYAQAYLNLSAALQQLQRLDEAIDVCRQLLAREPRNLDARNNLGTALEQLGRLEEAEAFHRETLAMGPPTPNVYYNLGLVLQRQGRVEEAIAAYHQALTLNPDYFEAWNNLGNVLQTCGHVDEAEAAFRKCVQLCPERKAVGQNLANILHLRGRLAEAEQEYRRILVEHDQPAVRSNLGATLQAQGRIEEALEQFRRAADMMPEEDSFHSNLLLALNYSPGVTAADLATAHAEWQRRHGAPWKSAWRPHANSRDPERILRLGFVSGDLWEHPVGHLVAPLMENLDRRACQVFCYYDNARNDRITERIRNTADLWRSVCGVSDQALADQIRADGVDVLFDLAGHTAQNRLRVFARKPAPIQITWAGYVGTTGLAAMDYLLADRYEVPEGAEGHYCESILRMPDGYICYGPPPDAPPVGPLPALARGQFTFGSFNNPAKQNAEVVALWSRVLSRVPNSRLMFKYRGCDNVPVQDYFRRLFAQHGIGPERLEFVAPSLHRGVFEAYHQVDLGLDPFPYSGGLTTCEALWMGVPVITCPSSTFASRHTLTHASNAGMGQFVARDFDHYVELAAEWAGDLSRLAALRAGMRSLVAASPLCDAKRFAANFQRVIRDAWRRWARG